MNDTDITTRYTVETRNLLVRRPYAACCTLLVVVAASGCNDEGLKASKLITPEAGGTLTLADGLEVTIPPEALIEPTLVEVERVEHPTDPYYVLEPADAVLQRPIQVRMPGAPGDTGIYWNGEAVTTTLVDGSLQASLFFFGCGDTREGSWNPSKTLHADGVWLYEEKECGTNVSVVVADRRAVHVRGAVPMPEPPQAVAECEGQTILKGQFLGEMASCVHGMIAGINGDLYNGDRGEGLFCHRSRTIVAGTPQREDVMENGLQVAFSNDADELSIRTADIDGPKLEGDEVVSSGWWYIRDGVEEDERPSDVPKRHSRAAIGWNDRYVMFVVSDKHGRELTFGHLNNIMLEGFVLPDGSETAGAKNLYRMDEGDTQTIVYRDEPAGEIRDAEGSAENGKDRNKVIHGLFLVPRDGESIVASPTIGSWTPSFQAQVDCTCEADSTNCHTLYQGRVTAICGNTAALEFRKVDPPGGPPSTTVHYWVAVGEADYPSCRDLPNFKYRTDGVWLPTEKTLSVSVDIWPDQAAFEAAPCGDTKKLFVITGGNGSETGRSWFQEQAIVFTKSCN